MAKTFFFISGMPRSGSTLLANILNQNPGIRATPTSGLCPLLIQTNHAWHNIPEIRASASALDRVSVLRSMFEGYHANIEQQVVINKSRGWVTAVEMLTYIFETRPKILVTYRDLPSILSSCEKLFRREFASPKSTAQWGSNMETIEGRLAFWTGSDQMVGGAYNRIRDCVMRGHRQCLHFVNFDELTSNPARVMQSVYDFLGLLPNSCHDFSNVAQTTYENDSEHGFVDLHTIRPDIIPVKKDYREVLGEAIKPYLGFNYDFIG